MGNFRWVQKIPILWCLVVIQCGLIHNPTPVPEKPDPPEGFKDGVLSSYSWVGDAFYYYAVALHNDAVFIAGGRKSGGVSSNQVTRIDLNTGISSFWTTLPVEVSGPGFLQDGSTLWLFGGVSGVASINAIMTVDLETPQANLIGTTLTFSSTLNKVVKRGTHYLVCPNSASATCDEVLATSPHTVTVVASPGFSSYSLTKWGSKILACDMTVSSKNCVQTTTTSADVWTPAPSLVENRIRAKFLTLQDGGVVAWGGSSGNSLNSMEYLPAAASNWTKVQIPKPRFMPNLSPLSDGSLLIWGGGLSLNVPQTVVERYFPSLGIIQEIGVLGSNSPAYGESSSNPNSQAFLGPGTFHFSSMTPVNSFWIYRESP